MSPWWVLITMAPRNRWCRSWSIWSIFSRSWSIWSMWSRSWSIWSIWCACLTDWLLGLVDWRFTVTFLQSRLHFLSPWVPFAHGIDWSYTFLLRRGTEVWSSPIWGIKKKRNNGCPRLSSHDSWGFQDIRSDFPSDMILEYSWSKIPRPAAPLSKKRFPAMTISVVWEKVTNGRAEIWWDKVVDGACKEIEEHQGGILSAEKVWGGTGHRLKQG